MEPLWRGSHPVIWVVEDMEVWEGVCVLHLTLIDWMSLGNHWG